MEEAPVVEIDTNRCILVLRKTIEKSIKTISLAFKVRP